MAYRDSARLRDKRARIPEVVDVVRAVPKDHTGDLPVPDSIADLVRRCTIRRGGFRGPCFNVESAGSFSDPLVSAVHSKINKVYQTEDVVDLLAFYLHMPLFPSAAWASAALQEAETAIAESRFDGLWVYDAAKERIACVYPPFSSEAGANKCVNLPVRPVTAVACATSAPGRPASYARR